MAEIPKEYLPTKEYVAESVFTLPELQFPRKISIMRNFYDNQIKNWDRVAIYWRDDRITFSELRKRVNKLANGLKNLGVGKNDRVCIRMPNCPEFIYSVHACWTIGAIPVMVTNLLRKREIVHRANDSEAKVFICSSDTWMDMDESIPEFKTVEKTIVVGERKEGCLFYDDLVRDQSEECEIEDTDKLDIVKLLYSSGTTGMPKGTILYVVDLFIDTETHARKILHLTDKDVLGGCAAYAFAFGGHFAFYQTGTGCSLSIVDSPTPEEMFELVEKHKITVMMNVPTLYKRILAIENAENKYDLSSLRVCQSAGEPLPGSIRDEWGKRFRVDLIDSLGSSEMVYMTSLEEWAPADKSGSIGKPMPGVQIKIVDKNFNEVPRGEVGEVLMKGPHAQKYWRRPDAQMKAVHNGWNRVGLIGSLDKDGYFWLKGRADDSIVSSGYKIPGGEVETALMSHPAVIEAAVVASPDPARGSVVKAFVVLKEGCKPSDELKKELQDFVKSKIEPYKYPRKMEFADAEELPRTSTGKIQRFALREAEERLFEGERKGN